MLTIVLWWLCWGDSMAPPSIWNLEYAIEYYSLLHGWIKVPCTSTVQHTLYMYAVTLIKARAVIHIMYNYIPNPNQHRKKGSDSLWWNYDETYDVIAVNTISKCLAQMKGCWDPEFEPSIEDYRWYMAILSVRFLWQARTLGDFPIQSSTWQVKVTSGSIGSSRAPQ